MIKDGDTMMTFSFER